MSKKQPTPSTGSPGGNAPRPKALTARELAWLKFNPNINASLFSELKSALNLRNLTGANSIEAALGINGKGQGLSAGSRVLSGLSGLVQGLGMAAGASKGGVAAEGAINSGIPARMANKLRGETVLVHGSPVGGLKEITPSFSRATPNEALVYGMRTDVPFSAQKQTRSVTESYANGNTWRGDESRGALPSGGGSIYVIKTPKSQTNLPNYPRQPQLPERNAAGRPILRLSPSPATTSKVAGRVVGEIPVKGKSYMDLDRLLERELKRAGAKVQPSMVERIFREYQKRIK